MTTRELIKTIRAHKDGADQFNAMLEECASKIEDFLGGPEAQPLNQDEVSRATDGRKMAGVGFPRLLFASAWLLLSAVCLPGGIVVAFSLAYRWAGGDAHWTTMAGCSWSIAWLLFWLALSRLVVAWRAI